MSFDAHKNLAYSTVATAPSPATSGTSVILASGEGARFPDPGTDGDFNVTIWPADVIPTPANAEIARCTARTTDTLTLTRAQEGTTARTVIIGDQIALTITAKTLTDIESATTLGGGANICAKVRRTTDQSIPNNTGTPLSYDTADYDTDSMIDLGTHPTRITFNTDGVYLLVGAMFFDAASDTAYRTSVICKNGDYTNLELGEELGAATGGGNSNARTVTAVDKFTVGDYVEFLAYQGSGGALNVKGSLKLHEGAVFTATLIALG